MEWTLIKMDFLHEKSYFLKCSKPFCFENDGTNFTPYWINIRNNFSKQSFLENGYNLSKQENLYYLPFVLHIKL